MVLRVRDRTELHDPIICFETYADIRDWCSDSHVSMELFEVKDISHDPIGISSALASIVPGEIVLRILRPRKSKWPRIIQRFKKLLLRQS